MSAFAWRAALVGGLPPQTIVNRVCSAGAHSTACCPGAWQHVRHKEAQHTQHNTLSTYVCMSLPLILLEQDTPWRLMRLFAPDQHGRRVRWFADQFMGDERKVGRSLQALIRRDMPIKENNPYGR